MKDSTHFDTFQSEIRAWWNGFLNKPFRTFLLGLLIVILFGLASIAPRAAEDTYYSFFPPKPANPYHGQKITFSNGVPVETDVIDLDGAGTLTPAPHNARLIKSSEGLCVPVETPLEYASGIVLVLNVAPTFVANPEDEKAVRAIVFPQAPASDYLIFTAGETRKIKTGGRTFNVTLSRINDLSTMENGKYYSYVFLINEE